jgi:hypothetical protein
MAKSKKPRPSKNPSRKDVERGDEQELERETQEKAALVPPSRLPPTAVGVGTRGGGGGRPPLPSRPPHPSPEPHRRPALFRALQAVRAAVGAVLDLADAAAAAVTKALT